MEKVAWPEESMAPKPSTVLPSLKVTYPVGVPPPWTGATVAVNVIGWLHSDGFADEARVVLVLREPV